MKNIVFIFFLISTSFYAQNYEKNWNKVIENENDGKVKSANEIVDKIYKKAVSKKEEDQIIKCFFYRSKYSQVLDEDAKSKILNDLKYQINQASIPSKAILNLIYGKCLNDYNENYENFDDAIVDTTAAAVDTIITASFNKNDDVLKIFEKTLENEAVLKATPLTHYESIFDFFTLEKFKKENLFAYLLKENIEFYKSRINEWQFEPKEFEFNKSILLGDTEAFTQLNLDFVKDENLKKLLSLYQKQEADSLAFENKLERILFCNQYLLQSDEDLLNALISLEKEIKEPVYIQKIKVEKATIYMQLASKETHPDYNIKALEELESVLINENNSNSYKQALQTKEQLLTKTVQLELKNTSTTRKTLELLFDIKTPII